MFGFPFTRYPPFLVSENQKQPFERPPDTRKHLILPVPNSLEAAASVSLFYIIIISYFPHFVFIIYRRICRYLIL